MKQGDRGETSVHVAAPPETVYSVVSDVTRMGEWSPETFRCVWLDGATGPAVGARFKGSNKRGVFRWSTSPTVVAAEPGKEFAFVTEFRGQKLTQWTYRFEPDGTGTKVTESFEMVADEPRFIDWVQRNVMRLKDRQADLVAGMQETLGRIKAAVERSAAAA